MKLIFALGNPGAEYAQTRHNIGWLALDYYNNTHEIGDFQPKTKFHAHIAEFVYHDQRILLAKPTTFYNQAGQSAREIMAFYKLSLDDILVIHDDMTIDFGALRIRRGGQDAGNNGLRSLHQYIGNDFWHIRIGTNDPSLQSVDATSFVLGRLTLQDTEFLTETILPDITQMMSMFLSGTLEPHTVRHTPPVSDVIV